VEQALATEGRALAGAANPAKGAPKTRVTQQQQAQLQQARAGPSYRPGQKPSDAPSGTRAINEHPDTKDIVHDIKKRLAEEGVGPASYVGIFAEGVLLLQIQMERQKTWGIGKGTLIRNLAERNSKWPMNSIIALA
jgi:hypothetical protein